MYIQIEIVNFNQFVIRETQEKRISRGSALFTLKQIQRIFEKQMRYCQIEKDAYSALPLLRVYAYLQEKAEAIQEGFIQKTLKVSRCFQRKLRLKRAEVRDVFFQIQQKRVFSFSKDVTLKVLDYLTIKELFIFSQVTHTAKREIDSVFLLRLERLGFSSRDQNSPRQFILSFKNEVDSLQQKQFIPPRYHDRDWESTLNNLKAIPSEEVLAFFSHPDIYREKCLFLTRYLLKNTLPTESSFELRGLGSYGLILSMQLGYREAAELLCYHGASLNRRDEKGDSPLLVFARRGEERAVHFLLMKGADPNRTDLNGNTPLHWAASLGFDAVVLLLLQFKADPRLLNRNGKDPLSLGARHPPVRAHLERALVGVAK